MKRYWVYQPIQGPNQVLQIDPPSIIYLNNIGKKVKESIKNNQVHQVVVEV